jgi:Bacterial mobilisation protein (MobC)
MSKSKKRRADTLRQAWFTKTEAAKLDTLAEPYGGFANLVRAALLDRRPRASKYDLQALARLSYEIGKLGGNVNQLAKRANEGRYNADAIEDAAREITEWRGMVLEALGEQRPKPPPDDPE